MNTTNTFEERRITLRDLSDEQLKQRFWELADQAVSPLVDLARGHTSPSIERSVLLRMGFSSLEAKTIVDKVAEAHLLGKGVGHVVLRAAERWQMPYLAAGRKILSGGDVGKLF